MFRPLALCCALLFSWGLPGGPLRAAAPLPMRPLTAEDSLLVIAPHPDDETLCCGGTISLARRAGARVTVAWVTSGDGSRATALLGAHSVWPRRSVYRSLGLQREAEGRRAATILGVDADALYFLGYPDTGIRVLAGPHFDTPWRSRRTRLIAVATPDALSPGAAYEGRNVVADLRLLIERTQPTLVLAPSILDTHPDHQGVAQLAMRALGDEHALDRLRVWIVHGGGDWPYPRRAEPAQAQRIPTTGRALAWTYVPLDPIAVSDKDRATRAHASARRVMARKMDGFIRSTELFAAVDAAEPAN